MCKVKRKPEEKRRGHNSKFRIKSSKKNLKAVSHKIVQYEKLIKNHLIIKKSNENREYHHIQWDFCINMKCYLKQMKTLKMVSHSRNGEFRLEMSNFNENDKCIAKFSRNNHFLKFINHIYQM